MSRLKPKQLRKAQQKLLECLPIDGSSIPNDELRRLTGSKKAAYEVARDSLLAAESIGRTQGYGGPVYLVSEAIVDKRAKAIADVILKHIPKDGSVVTNRAVREAAELDKPTYLVARKKLIEKGAISRGRGMAGTVYRVAAAGAAKKKTKARRVLEKKLYGQVQEVLRESWTAENGIADFVIQTTAHQGSRRTGGKWTRPDIVVVAVQRFRYVPGTVLTLATFEVKGEGRWGIESVYETAAHSAFAHKSYLAIHAPKLELTRKSREFDRLVDHAERFNIGVMVFEDPANWDTYEVVLEAARNQPDPSDVDDFVETQLDKASRAKLVKKLEVSINLKPPS